MRGERGIGRGWSLGGARHILPFSLLRRRRSSFACRNCYDSKQRNNWHPSSRRGRRKREECTSSNAVPGCTSRSDLRLCDNFYFGRGNNPLFYRTSLLCSSSPSTACRPVCTVRVDSLPHRKWREIQQQPGTAGPGNMLGCCLISFHFLWGKG